MNAQGQSLPNGRAARPLWTACCGLLFLGAIICAIVGSLTARGPSKELQLASSYIQAENYAQAETVLAEASRRFPSSSAVANKMAWTLYLDHKFAEAEPYAVRSVARGRRSYNLDTLAHIELGLGKIDAAEIGFKEALEIDPKNGDSLEGLGQIAELKGRLADALSAYKRARAYEPAIKGIDERIAHVQRLMR